METKMKAMGMQVFLLKIKRGVGCQVEMLWKKMAGGKHRTTQASNLEKNNL